MKRGLVPATLPEQLSAIEEKFLTPGKKIDETKLIVLVLNVASNKYQSVLTAAKAQKVKALPSWIWK
jgi:hypothetical protein